MHWGGKFSSEHCNYVFERLPFFQSTQLLFEHKCNYKICDEHIDGIVSHRNSENVPLQKVRGKMFRIGCIQMLRVLQTSGKSSSKYYLMFFGILNLF
jgi:hypothetical protein